MPRCVRPWPEEVTDNGQGYHNSEVARNDQVADINKDNHIVGRLLRGPFTAQCPAAAGGAAFTAEACCCGTLSQRNGLFHCLRHAVANTDAD